MKLYEPIGRFATLRINQTLHGRSVFRPTDVPGHNVFKGYSTPGTGDALDLFCPGVTPVYAVGDGKIVRWQNDATRKEVVYVEGDGWTAVYAHVDFNQTTYRVGDSVTGGVSSIGRVRSDLRDPHLHFELWLHGKAVAAASPKLLQNEMRKAFGGVSEPAKPKPWYADAQAWVKQHGISDGSDPTGDATRAEVWEMLRRYDAARNAGEV